MKNNVKEFLREYERLHAACPKCGSGIYLTTLLGFAVDAENLDNYKNLNLCTCDECGDIHTCDDRVVKK